MCYTAFFINLDSNDPSNIVQDGVNKFLEKHTSILKNNKYDFLTKRFHKISNFYMKLKLHKSKEINKIVEKQDTEYIWIDENHLKWGRLTVAGPVFRASRISEILHYVMESALSLILGTLLMTHSILHKD